MGQNYKNYDIAYIDDASTDYTFEKAQQIIEDNNFPKEWLVFNKIFNKKNFVRKECLLLPFKTLAKALNI